MSAQPLDALAAAIVEAAVELRQSTAERTAARVAWRRSDYGELLTTTGPKLTEAVRRVTAARKRLRYVTDRYAALLASRKTQA